MTSGSALHLPGGSTLQLGAGRSLLCNCTGAVYICRYNCNRYNEDEAKKARDAQEVSHFVYYNV